MTFPSAFVIPIAANCNWSVETDPLMDDKLSIKRIHWFVTASYKKAIFYEILNFKKIHKAIIYTAVFLVTSFEAAVKAVSIEAWFETLLISEMLKLLIYVAK